MYQHPPPQSLSPLPQYKSKPASKHKHNPQPATHSPTYQPRSQNTNSYSSPPTSSLEACKSAIFAAGAGRYPNGRYAECCWTVVGRGQFRPGGAANPHTGTVGKLEFTDEARVEVMCIGEDVARKVVVALKSAHPYEEPSYGVVRLEDF